VSVKIEGLAKFRRRIRGGVKVVTTKRRQAEGRAVRDFAKKISPVKTGAFKKGWRFTTTAKDAPLVVFNNVEYARWVHPKQDPRLIQERVRAYAEERAPQFAADIASLTSSYIARFRSTSE